MKSDPDPHVTDAEFTVVRGPDQPPVMHRPLKRRKDMADWPEEDVAEWNSRPLWRRYRLLLDWRAGLLGGAVALLVGLPRLIEVLTQR